MRPAVVLALILSVSTPIRGQEKRYPRFDLSAAYGSADSLYSMDGTTGRYQGITSQQSFYLNRWIGLTNDIGYYKSDSTTDYNGSPHRNSLFSIVPGVKLSLRKNELMAPYALAGFGMSRYYIPSSSHSIPACYGPTSCLAYISSGSTATSTYTNPPYSETGPSVRAGGGVDLFLLRGSVGKGISSRLEVSDMISSPIASWPQSVSTWTSGYSISVGLVFTPISNR
jgi:hypothetical protein